MKTRGFTLLEILAVVLVIGVLATVAVPKFKRILETRKTQEAEGMLLAVRTEQEKRCTMGEPYLTNAQDISVLSSAFDSANYNFLLHAAGMTAQSKTQAYSLSMPSYKNGEMCCTGEYCGSLNKNYPDCSTLEIGEDECAAEEGEEICTLQCLPRFTLNEETCTCECNRSCPLGNTLNPLTCLCQEDSIPDDGDDCTFSAWGGVSSSGSNTCGKNPTTGCVEYKACVSGSSDFPCGAGATATTRVEDKTDNCGVGFSKCQPIPAGSPEVCSASPMAAFTEAKGCSTSQYRRSCPGTSTVPSVICSNFSGTCILSAETHCESGDGYCIGRARNCNPMEYNGEGVTGCLKECTCTPQPAKVTYVVCESGDGGYPYYKRTCLNMAGPLPFPKD